MKNKIAIFYIGALMLLFCSCSPSQDLMDEPSYRTVKKAEESSPSRSTTPLPADTIIDDIAQPEVDIIPELTGFTGITSDSETPACGNLSMNMKQGSTLCLVCPDYENDVIYYVNYGDDGYIYQLKDGKSTLVLDRMTTSIQLWDNEIYFLSGDEFEVYNDFYYSKQGIYQYNLATKELRRILDVDAHWLYVNEDGIFYTEMSDDGKFIMEGYRLPFDRNTPQKMDYAFFSQYKDYLFIPALDDSGKQNMVLVNMNTGEEIFELPSISYNKAGIYGNHLYYKGNNQELNCLNLDSGEKVVYDLRNNDFGIIYPDNRLPFQNNLLTGYTELNGEVFITNDSAFIFRANLFYKKITLMLVDNNVIGIYLYLFTSGDRMFAVKKHLADPETFVELVVSADSIIEKEIGE